MSRHNQLGKQGEEQARQFLQNKGYIILETNWRSGRAEVDIIAQTNGTLIFIEVKTRTNYAFGYPEEAVHSAKEKMMAKAAEAYLYEKNIDAELRFDIVAVYFSRDDKWFIKHFEDAFFPNPADETEDHD